MQELTIRNDVFTLEDIKKTFLTRFSNAAIIDFKLDPVLNLSDRMRNREAHILNAQWEIFMEKLPKSAAKSATTEEKPPIFVFGSNEAGIHGAGAALFARQNRGAVYGKGIGHHGNSYGIPTKDFYVETLPLPKIKVYVDQFLQYATQKPHLKFEVTRIGCGLAGYTDKDIAPMFKGAPENCQLPEGWKDWETTQS